MKVKTTGGGRVLIGELSRRTGVSRRALRYYEEQRLLVPARTANGYRHYAADAPVVVEQIQGLFAAGLDSVAVRRYLPCARDTRPRLALCPALRAHLVARSARLEEQAAAPARQRANLAAYLADL